MTGVEQTERAVERMLAGDRGAHPVAALLRSALPTEMPSETARVHLDAIATATSPPSAVVSLAARRPARGRTRRRLAVAGLAAAMLLTLGASSALAASADAAPGHPLYGLKRASERMALAMRRSPESKAVLHVRFAERRLAEINALLGAGDDASALERDYAEALTAAAGLARVARDGGADTEDLLAFIEEQTRRHLERLLEIREGAPEQAHAGLDTAIENAEAANDRARTERGRPGEPGNSGDAPGRGGETPGRGGQTPGGNAPGNGGEAPGNSGDAPVPNRR